MNIDVLTYYPAMIVVTRLQVEENGRQEIIPEDPNHTRGLGKNEIRARTSASIKPAPEKNQTLI